MANELKEICDLLDGYRAMYEVLAAAKADDGTWELKIKKIEPVTTNQEEPKESADDNQ